MNDNGQIKKLIDTFYRILSGKAGEERNWDQFRSLFFPGARLTPNYYSSSGICTTKSYDVDSYIAKLSSFLKNNNFYEHGYNYTIQCYGNIAQVYSLYEAKADLNDEKPIKRGINLLLLIKDDKKWKIVNMLWEDQ